MKRGLPFFSPLSIAFSALIIMGLAVAVLLTGGRMFNPGPVSAKSRAGVSLQGFTSHAGFESQCSRCHQPLKTIQAELCVACHTDVGQQLSSHSGFHGRLSNAAQCADCHAEHRGRSFDPTRQALLSFDHALTRFPLTGKHAQIQCADCHKNGDFTQAPTQCADCHHESLVHARLFPAACEDCHTTQAWTPATVSGKPFDHEATAFSLVHHAKDFVGNGMACTACHNQPAGQFDPQTCVDCHAAKDLSFMTAHVQQFGPECLQCHDGRDRMQGFDHAAVFPLAGRHARLACESCHANKQFASTPTQCVRCHAEPVIHAGFFGLKCEYCHTAQAWQPALLRLHPFPLDHGGNGQVSCQTCHTQKYAEYTCYGCHDHQPEEIQASHARAGIGSDRLPDCAACHLSGKVEAPTP